LYSTKGKGHEPRPLYAQEELLLFGEKLYVSGALALAKTVNRLNGKTDKVEYTIPRASASYRFYGSLPPCRRAEAP
jgi:hypothetical protein